MATALASCVIEGNNPGGGDQPEGEKKFLVVKFDGISEGKTRAIEEPGSSAKGTIKLTDGQIFVLSPQGEVIDHGTLVVEDAVKATGYKFPRQVNENSRIYVIGNYPVDGPAPNSLRTLDEIQAVRGAITTYSDYTRAVLGNAKGLPVTLNLNESSTPHTGTAVITLKPVFSRIELVAVESSVAAGTANNAKGAITRFNVTGVYLDEYYDYFTYGGGNWGDLYTQKQSTDFSRAVGDAGTWAATADPRRAVPASGKVWAHNVVSNSLPRLIVRMNNIQYNDKVTGTATTLNETKYLSVRRYLGMEGAKFEPGKIYRVTIKFDQDHLGQNPNPEFVDLIVAVQVEEWIIETPTAELQGKD